MTWSCLFFLLIALGTHEQNPSVAVEPENRNTLKPPGHGLRTDRQGDPLPVGALTRLGTTFSPSLWL
jgi:hypothetical protein